MKIVLYIKKINIKETELYKKHGLKGVKHQLYFWFPFAFLALGTTLYSLCFKAPETKYYLLFLIAPLIVAMIVHYLYVTILFIKFIKIENMKREENNENFNCG